jgi:hypothetical protein
LAPFGGILVLYVVLLIKPIGIVVVIL